MRTVSHGTYPTGLEGERERGSRRDRRAEGESEGAGDEGRERGKESSGRPGKEISL